MKLGKNGRPFRYPHSLMLFLGTEAGGLWPTLPLAGGARRGVGQVDLHPRPLLTSALREAPPQAGVRSWLGLPAREWEEVVIAVDGASDQGDRSWGMDASGGGSSTVRSMWQWTSRPSRQ